jgi:hypothetical protein
MADGKAGSDRRKMRAAAATCVLAATLAACGDDESAAPTTTRPLEAATTQSTPSTSTTTTRELAPDEEPRGEPTKPAEAPPGDPRVNELERKAAATVRRFVAALNARDGDAVCASFAPGALDEVELPEKDGDCGQALSASIGYRDPRGLPVWKSAALGDVRVAELDPDARSAKVIATVVTTFADRNEPSFEDDVIYLTLDRDGWLIAKPSSTLYRAIGISDIPPSVLTPPSN